jgi:hypothetical protein
LPTVTPALAGVALAVVVGGLLAVSARAPRSAVFGLLIVLVGSSFVAEPLPESLGLAARLVAAVLASELLWISVRGVEFQTDGSRLGWPAEALVAAAGGAVGYGSHGLGAPALGPAEAQVAGFALAALAIAPLLNGNDILRIGIGLNLLLAGVLLVAVALGGTRTPDELLVVGGLVVVVGGSVAAMVRATRTDGGSLEPWSGTARTRRPEAHPLDGR